LVVTEEMIRAYAREHKRRVCVPKQAVITPLARDTARDKKIEIVQE
jgi:ethanolamine utilization cobalamin adenosyltransferase